MEGPVQRGLTWRFLLFQTNLGPTSLQHPQHLRTVSGGIRGGRPSLGVCARRGGGHSWGVHTTRYVCLEQGGWTRGPGVPLPGETTVADGREGVGSGVLELHLSRSQLCAGSNLSGPRPPRLQAVRWVGVCRGVGALVGPVTVVLGRIGGPVPGTGQAEAGLLHPLCGQGPCPCLPPRALPVCDQADVRGRGSR